MTKTSPTRDDAAQSRAFIEKAQELEADGDDSKADALMNRLAKMKPEPRQKKTPAPVKTGPGRSKKVARSPN